MTPVPTVTSSRTEPEKGPSAAAPVDAQDTLREHKKRLAALMRSPALAGGDVAQGLIQVTELAAELLGMDRVGVWQLSADGATLECLDLFLAAEHTHQRGLRLAEVDHPQYF